MNPLTSAYDSLWAICEAKDLEQAKTIARAGLKEIERQHVSYPDDAYCMTIREAAHPFPVLEAFADVLARRTKLTRDDLTIVLPAGATIFGKQEP